jgi:hypothetical protein
MQVSIENNVEFRDTGGKLIASYHYDDPFKSFFRSLCTPKGRDVVAPLVADHPHHKGLQYGLCAEDVNFWEEDHKSDGGNRRIGRQIPGRPQLLTANGEIGFSQQIVWRDDVCESFHETRSISVQPTTSGYAWNWRTTLIAKREVRLIVSAWPQQGGYCGLGLRLAPGLFLKKSTVTSVPQQQGVSGSVPKSIGVRGAGVELMFEQDTRSQQNVLYIQGCDADSEGDFAFLSLGPTNRAPCTIEQGKTLTGNYLITVADI